MKIAITGSTGLIGTAVVRYFKGCGHCVTRIVRSGTKSKSQEPILEWDIPAKLCETQGLEALDVVIHLAGANIAGARWTKNYKQQITSSRIEGTRLLCSVLGKLQQPPKVLCSASAIGFYGNHLPQETIDETAGAGADFLANLCQEWEGATQPAQDAGIRVIHMRFGAVLSSSGGAIAKMFVPFKCGLGGKLASGKQMFSWIALDEIPVIISYMIEKEDISGPVNVVAPHPVSNAEFTKEFGRVIRRPTILPVPGFALRLLLGEMADSLLLGGARVIPQRLQRSGYSFQYPDLHSALTAALSRNNGT